VKPIRSAGSLLCAALVAACGRHAAQAGAPESMVWDSAGVRIMQNGAVPAAAWRVATQALFTVGWEPDGPNFTWPQSGRILPDGGALVGEFGERTIYRIGPDGAVLATWGREGEGPGEYQALDAILFLGDSILVSDGRLRRLTLLSADGEVRHTRVKPGAPL